MSKTLNRMKDQTEKDEQKRRYYQPQGKMLEHRIPELSRKAHSQDGFSRNDLNPIGTCSNVDQVGAVLAVAIKAASIKTGQVSYPLCFSALLLITGPAVLGVGLGSFGSAPGWGSSRKARFLSLI